MTRRYRLEVAVEADGPEELVEGMDDALRKFVDVFTWELGYAVPEDATDVTMDSSPHPSSGWTWRLVEDLDALPPAEATRAAHIAAGGAVRRPPDGGG
jgi:hypothetical protein